MNKWKEYDPKQKSTRELRHQALLDSNRVTIIYVFGAAKLVGKCWKMFNVQCSGICLYFTRVNRSNHIVRWGSIPLICSLIRLKNPETPDLEKQRGSNLSSKMFLNLDLKCLDFCRFSKTCTILVDGVCRVEYHLFSLEIYKYCSCNFVVVTLTLSTEERRQQGAWLFQ